MRNLGSTETESVIRTFFNMNGGVDEDYVKIGMVGRGSYGLVWHGKRKSDSKHVAVKEIKIDHLESKEYSVILSEINILAQVNHPNIITYLGSYITSSCVSIIMELADRGSLHKYLTEQDGQLLEEEVVFGLFAQLVLGLHYLHSRNIIHRDLKTHNILLLDRGKMNFSQDALLVKISDFGLSKILTSHSDASSVLGTPSYSAPEICSGLPYTERSDIWSLGCILYEMLTLQKAFEAPTLAAVVFKIMRGEVKPVTNRPCSTALTHLVNGLLHQTPNQRPSTSALMAHPFIARNIFRTHASIGCSSARSPPQQNN